MNDQLSLFEQVPPPALTETEFDARLEALATDIEVLQATAVLHVAERLAEAHGMFLYKRDAGGFTGWVERRLRMSRRTAYNLLDVHKQFGDQSVQILHTLPRSVLYLIARGGTSPEARAEVIERAGAGEEMSYTKARAIVTKAKAPKVSEPDLDPAPAAESTPIPPDQFPVKHHEPTVDPAPRGGQRDPPHAPPPKLKLVLSSPLRPHPRWPGWDYAEIVWVVDEGRK